MCAILGMCGNVRRGQWRQTHDLLTALFVESMRRGKDASGFAASLSPLDRPSRIGAVTSKEALPSNIFVRVDPAWQLLRQRRCSAVIGHTRWATHGSPFDNRNNHPFASDNGYYVAHNGILHQHQETADRLGLRLTTECDSELLMRVVEASGDPVAGAATCLSQCRASMALAVLDPRRERVVLARNSGRPLYILRMKDDQRTFFASTEAILIEAFRHVFGRPASMLIDLLVPVADDVVHVLTADGSIRAVTFSRKIAPITPFST